MQSIFLLFEKPMNDINIWKVLNKSFESLFCFVMTLRAVHRDLNYFRSSLLYKIPMTEWLELDHSIKLSLFVFFLAFVFPVSFEFLEAHERKEQKT